MLIIAQNGEIAPLQTKYRRLVVTIIASTICELTTAKILAPGFDKSAENKLALTRRQGSAIVTRLIDTMRMMTSDIELVARAIGGDAAAFSALLERHYDMIYGLAWRMLGNRQDAEDVTQDVCVALPQKLVSFQAKSKLTTWLYRVTLNCCRDFIRRQVSVDKKHANYLAAEASHQLIDVQRQTEIQWAYNAINSLPDYLRETALLVVAQDLKHDEVARILEIRPSTVSWRMLKVRQHLKQLAQSEAGYCND